MKDNIQDSGGIICVDGHALWTIQCTKYFREIDESSVETFLEKFVVVYFDDILIYSSNEAEHIQYLR